MSKLASRIKREKEFFDHEALSKSEYWGWKTKTGALRHGLRGRLISKYISPKKSDNILELGCGLGGLTQTLTKLKGRLYVTDLSPASLDFTKRKVSSKKVLFLLEDAHNLSFRDNFFNAAVGNGILHHLDHKVALTEIFRVLKPGGKICFTEPNLLNPEIFLERKIPLFRKLSRSSLDEIAFIRWQLKKDLEKAKFIKVSVSPYDFLYPAIPYFLAKPCKILSDLLEKVPLVKEFSGSLFVTGEKG